MAIIKIDHGFLSTSLVTHSHHNYTSNSDPHLHPLASTRPTRQGADYHNRRSWFSVHVTCHSFSSHTPSNCDLHLHRHLASGGDYHHRYGCLSTSFVSHYTRNSDPHLHPLASTSALRVVITIIDMVFCPRHLSVIIRETLTLIFTLWHQRRPQVAIIITHHGQSFSSITLTLPFTRWRHIAQVRRAGAHCAQQTRWPQGRKRMLTSFTWQILQVLSWPISWFSPSRSETRMWTTVSFEQLSLSAFLLQLEYYHH